MPTSGSTWRLALAAGALVVGGLAACGDDGDEGLSTTTEAGPERTTTTEAGHDADGQPIQTGEVGGPAIVVGDVGLTVVSVGEPYDFQGDQVVDIEVRAENLGQQQLTSPVFMVQCNGEYYVGQWDDVGETYDQEAPFPPGTVLEGKFVSSFPADCESPTIVIDDGTGPVARWPL